MAIGINIFAPINEASLSMVNPIFTFPTTETNEEIVDRLLTRTIRKYFKGS